MAETALLSSRPTNWYHPEGFDIISTYDRSMRVVLQANSEFSSRRNIGNQLNATNKIEQVNFYQKKKKEDNENGIETDYYYAASKSLLMKIANILSSSSQS